MRRALALMVALALAPVPAGSAAAKDLTTCKARQAKLAKLTKAQRRQCRGPRHASAQPPVRPSGPLTQPPTVPPVTPPPLARLGVTTREFWLQLSRRQLVAGPALIELTNAGEDAHNLRIEPADGGAAVATFPVVESGARSKQRLSLAPGSYRVYCTLLDHDARGMHATLTVVR